MIYILVLSQKISPGLDKLAQFLGAKIILCGNVRLFEGLANLPAKANGSCVIVIKYPMESHLDIETIKLFSEYVVEKSGQWFYAPRPNPFLAVNEAGLVGFHRWTADGNQKLYADYLHKLYGLSPKWIRWFVKPLAKLFKSAIKHKVSKSSNEMLPDEVLNARLSSVGIAIQIPQNLQEIRGAWLEWQAPENTVRRDLLDRPEKFFSHPRGIHVIVLNKCNLQCVMCPYHSPAYKPAHKSDYFDEYRSMSPEVFSKIADYAGRHNIALQFGQIEEPLMHKGIVNFLREASSKGVKNIHMTTNGHLMDKEKSDQLVDSGLTSLMVSIDAVNSETYQKIRGADLSVLEANLRYFISQAKPKGIKVWVSFILQPIATSEREAFLAKWRDIGVDYITFYALGNHDLETGELIEFKHLYRRNEERYPCASPWTQSVIFPDGEVSLCCRTMGLLGWTGVIDVGTLASSPDFETIWAGEKYRTVRSELLNNEFEKYSVCKDCTIWSSSTSLVEVGEGYKKTFNETMETFEFR